MIGIIINPVLLTVCVAGYLAKSVQEIPSPIPFFLTNPADATAKTFTLYYDLEKTGLARYINIYTGICLPLPITLSPPLSCSIVDTLI